MAAAEVGSQNLARGATARLRHDDASVRERAKRLRDADVAHWTSDHHCRLLVALCCHGAGKLAVIIGGCDRRGLRDSLETGFDVKGSRRASNSEAAPSSAPSPAPPPNGGRTPSCRAAVRAAAARRHPPLGGPGADPVHAMPPTDPSKSGRRTASTLCRPPSSPRPRRRLLRRKRRALWALRRLLLRGY